jgi:hypothetical protein
MASLVAVDALNAPRKYLACVGFGIAAFQGVSHAHFLEAAAKRSLYLDLIRETETHREIGSVIEAFRHSLETVRKRFPLPM